MKFEDMINNIINCDCMKRIKEILKDRLVVLLFIILMLGSLTIFMLIVSSNKYDEELSKVKLENKKLQHQLKTSYNTITDYKKEHPECEYYIHPSGDDFVIDGQLYEKSEGYEAYE